MRLVITKVNQDIINGGAASVMVGIFEESGAKTAEFYVPRKNLSQDDAELRVGQELKLIPVEALK